MELSSMDDKASFAPSLPGWFLYPAIALLALQIIYIACRTRGAASQYLVLVCWTRYAMGALHAFTFRQAFPGLSWMAVASVLSILVGFVVVDIRRFFSAAFVPVAIICGLMVLSAFLN